MKYLLILIMLMSQSLSEYTIVNTGIALSSYLTSQPNVTYELRFTMAQALIPPGTQIILDFTTYYRIPPSSLSNCQVSKSESVPLASTTCESVYEAGRDGYKIYFRNVYPANQMPATFLWLKFDITNPWAEGTTRIDLTIQYSGHTLPIQITQH